MTSMHHCTTSAKRWGGHPDDYRPVHDLIDSSKSSSPDIRHRAALHHSFGIFIVERILGQYITNSNNKRVAVREIAEQHIREDLGFIPTLEDWTRCMPLAATHWAGGHPRTLHNKKIHIPKHISDKLKEFKII